MAASALPRSTGHPFYTRLNAVLQEADFDRCAETECEPYYADERGRPSIPPGTYFPMLLVGYFESIDAADGIKKPTEEDARRHDRRRRKKRVSNQDWQSTSDPESRTTVSTPIETAPYSTSC